MDQIFITVLGALHSRRNVIFHLKPVIWTYFTYPLPIGSWVVISSKLNSGCSVALGLRCKASLTGPQEGPFPHYAWWSSLTLGTRETHHDHGFRSALLLLEWAVYLMSQTLVQLLSPVWHVVSPWAAVRLPCLSLSPWVCSNSCPLSQCCHPTIPSSVIPVSSCPQSFPASGFFPLSRLFTSGGQSIGASASVSVLPVIIEGCFPLGLTAVNPCSPRESQRVFCNTTVWKHHVFSAQPSLWSSSYIHT